MAKEYAHSFYNSKSWKECRASYITSVHGLCERCQEKGIIKGGYIVHHKEYITPSNINNPEITLNHDNLEYVCEECHNKEHFRKHEAIREGLAIDEEGNIVEVD